MKIPDNPKELYNIIPVDIRDNIEFRIELHKMLAVDKKFGPSKDLDDLAEE